MKIMQTTLAKTPKVNMRKTLATKEFSSALHMAHTAKSKDLNTIFSEASKQYGVPENLLKAVAKAESNFHADAVSRCGAMGIMQLMPCNVKELGISDAFNPEQNIKGGAALLSRLLNRYQGDFKLTLAAYNAGEGNVAKYNGIPPFSETQNYVKKVMGLMCNQISGNMAQTVQQSEPALPSMESETFTFEDYKLFVEMFMAQMTAIPKSSPLKMHFLGLV